MSLKCGPASFNNNDLSHLDEFRLDLQWLPKICENMGFSILSALTQLGHIAWKPVESLEAVPIITKYLYFDS